MTQRSHVPKFGNWESEENVPYTAYFDKARKGRGGKLINPNDPEENPDLLSDNSSSGQGSSRTRAEPEEPIGQGVGRSTHERPRSREDGDLRQFSDSPARHDNVGHRTSMDSTHQYHGGRGVSSGEANRRPARQSAGSEYSIERSPLHRQARVSGGGVNSPSWEGKGSYESSHGTPGRSRLKPARGDESPDKGAAVPKFGEWDENNPASADGFTHIFNKVREERQNAGNPGVSSGTPYNNIRKQHVDANAKSCCFPWRKK